MWREGCLYLYTYVYPQRQNFDHHFRTYEYSFKIIFVFIKEEFAIN